jgi:hypothetical protein
MPIFYQWKAIEVNDSPADRTRTAQLPHGTTPFCSGYSSVGENGGTAVYSEFLQANLALSSILRRAIQLSL